jgi:hypothetical protein
VDATSTNFPGPNKFELGANFRPSSTTTPYSPILPQFKWMTRQPRYYIYPAGGPICAQTMYIPRKSQNMSKKWPKQRCSEFKICCSDTSDDLKSHFPQLPGPESIQNEHRHSQGLLLNSELPYDWVGKYTAKSS